MNHWQVLKTQSGISLQLFLKQMLGDKFSGKQIKRLIDAGKCTLNGRPERFASRLVGSGDKVTLEDSQRVSKPQRIIASDPKSILCSDKDLIAYDKPSGIASDNPALLKKLEMQFGALILLHRLDKETTGVLLFARNQKTATSIENLFKKRLVNKIYLALIDGVPGRTSGVIENFLGKVHVYDGQTIWGVVVPEKGLIAKTSWQIKMKGKDACLITCYPATGRTHQIRVHLSGLGHPILGDHQYGHSFKCAFRPQRTLLHAAEISFEHPESNQIITIKSPIPSDFTEAMKYLLDPP